MISAQFVGDPIYKIKGMLPIAIIMVSMEKMNGWLPESHDEETVQRLSFKITSVSISSCIILSPQGS